MTGKDVWRWILTKFDNDVLHQIYEKKKVVCKGFRTNTIQDISTNRNRLVTNLLSKDNYKKLVLWSAENPPTSLDGISLVDKELNELVGIATEKGVINVLIKLFCENQERKAIQFFAFLQDEQSNILDIPNQSMGETTTDETESSKKENEIIKTGNQTQEVEVIKSDGKKIKRLEKKVENLATELKKRDIIHKAKIEELDRNHQQTIQKLNEKNQLYSILLKEKESLTKEYQEEKIKWEKESSISKDTIACLEEEVRELREQIYYGSDQNAVQSSAQTKGKLRILVIGKPAYTTHFQSEMIEFSFVEGNDVHDFLFKENFDAYWVLSYELSNRDQLLLKVNDSYSKLDCNKVFICKDFNEVRKQLTYFSRLEERVI
jgi:hypothetical protein